MNPILCLLCGRALPTAFVEEVKRDIRENGSKKIQQSKNDEPALTLFNTTNSHISKKYGLRDCCFQQIITCIELIYDMKPNSSNKFS